MAVDQNSIPNPLRPLNPHPWTHPHDPPKVKLLCSFGGQIIPRPSDGALRYAGGQTRIIAVRRDASLPDIMNKMSQVFGGPAVLRYQLPDVDLDALVSVSSQEDLDNMMEEYDKLAEDTPDGSAKLRVFLFSPADLAAAADPVSQLILDDTGQRYVDAVNSVSNEGSLRRKDSTLSATSTQNSDGADAIAAGVNGGTSPAILSPTCAVAHDPTISFFVGAPTPVGFPDVPGLPSNPLAAGSNHPAQTLNPPHLEFSLPAPYSSQAYADPNQVQFINLQSLGINVVAVPPYPNAPPAIDNPTASMASQVGSAKLVLAKADSYLEDNPYGGRAGQIHGDPNYKAPPYQPLSQFLPFPPTYPQPQNVERYDLRQPVPPPSQGQALRFQDCYQCMKGLPHAHSDTLIQEHGNGSGSIAPEASAVFHSLRPEDAMRPGDPHRVINGVLTESVVEPKTENMVATGQFAAYGFAQIGNDKLVVLNAEGSDHGKVMHPSGMLGMPSEAQESYAMFKIPQSHQGDSLQQHLTQSLVQPELLVKKDAITNLYGNGAFSVRNVNGQATEPLSRGSVLPGTVGSSNDTQASYGMFINTPRSHHEDSLQQQLPHSLGQPELLVKKDVIADLYGNDAYSVKNVNGQATAGALSQGSVLESSYDCARPIDGMMEGLHVSPNESLMYNEKWKPIVTPSIVTSKESKPENPPLAEISHPVRSQVGGNTMFAGDAYTNSGVMAEGIYISRPVDQLLPSSFRYTQLHNLQPSVPSQVSTPGAFLFNQETGPESMVPNERLHDSVYPAHNNNTISKIPIVKDEASRYPKDTISDLAAPPSGKFPFPFPNSSSSTQHMELFQQSVPSDSLFCNQDPRNMGNTNLLPPRPIRVASKESVISRDLSAENLLVSNKSPDIAELLGEGFFYQPPNSLNKDSRPESPVPATRGSEEEKIKQELQAVAEGVAASVLQSSVPPVPIFVDRETKESTSQFNKERGVINGSASSQNAASLDDHRIEDIKTKQADKIHLGFPIGDEIGRLQIIKNSDLEELRELGSGTFGTVYHGKWRGSDVAIKRINDRCFAGKPSEQERTRADFWNEACKLADLHHPNVVAFYGVVLDGPGGCVATVTEYMVNGSLRHALQKNDKTLDSCKRLLIAMDVAFGMEYLHGKNIVHFDLKSDNLLVNLRDPQRPICKVGDLGLSKVKCQTLISGGVRGTLPWMAPELLNGSSSLVSEKVDVFSFGIVLWELLTGEEPYADLHYGAIIGGIVNNTLRPPVPEFCDPEWRSLMEKCWLSEPSERPSFTEIATQLRVMAASKGR